ncbi:MAG: molybdopterin molybdenumtransferase MoeA, partial [Pseudomonadota bacterium]
MISVEEAMNGLFALTSHVGDELLPLREAAGRVLAENVRAARAQPPFDASAMDGYALRFCDVAPGARLKVIGEAAAG